MNQYPIVGAIYSQLKSDLGFTEIYTPISAQAKLSYPADNLDACIFDVINNKIDMCAGYIPITQSRMQQGGSFTQPILYEDLSLYYYDRHAILKDDTLYDIFYYPFDIQFWYALLIVIGAHSIGRFVLEYNNTYLKDYGVILKLYYCLLSSMSGIIYYEEIQAETWPGRVLDFSMKFFKFLFFTLYISTFSMVVNERDTPISSLKEVINFRKNIVTNSKNISILQSVFADNYGLSGTLDDSVFANDNPTSFFNDIVDNKYQCFFSDKYDQVFTHLLNNNMCDKVYKLSDKLYKTRIGFAINPIYNKVVSSKIAQYRTSDYLQSMVNQFDFEKNPCLLLTKPVGSMYDLNKVISLFYIVYGICIIGVVVGFALKALVWVTNYEEVVPEVSEELEANEELDEDYYLFINDNIITISEYDARGVIFSVNKLLKLMHNGEHDVVTKSSILLDKYEIIIRKYD